MKIAFVNVLYDIDPGYAVSTVLLSHIRMVKKQGYEPVLITTKDSKLTDKETGCEVRKVMPVLQLKDYYIGMPMDKEHTDLIPEIEKSIREATQDCARIVEHDLILQGWYAPYGEAIKRINNITHVIHSQPNNQYVQNIPDDHKILVLNQKLVEQAKAAYHTQNVKVIENPVDIMEFLGFQDLTKQWINRWGLLDYDYIFTYPFCYTRWDTKGADWFAIFTKYMNNQGLKTAGVFLLSHANDCTRNFDTCHFSNAMFEEHKFGVKREIVRDFMLLSDGFFLPSTAETSSLVYMEAALAKNPVILNRLLKLPANSKTANLSETSNVMMETVLNLFLEESKPWSEFRRLRKSMNENIIGKKLCDLILEGV